MDVSIFWFRRDLRLDDNTGLNNALASNSPILPIFIFDTNIINELEKDDHRISFIYEKLQEINSKLADFGSSLLIRVGDPIAVFKSLINTYSVRQLFYNKDYEPYAIARDREVDTFLASKGIDSHGFKDQVIFEESEIIKNDGTPYTVFTPYKNKWLEAYKAQPVNEQTQLRQNFYLSNFTLPELSDIGFNYHSDVVKDYNIMVIDNYKDQRDIPHLEATSNLSPHLRFGTVSIRRLVYKFYSSNPVFVSELIWREFFMQILYHYPYVVDNNFKPKYDNISWRNNKQEFELWKSGKTGYPIVDAGMNQLNETGYMHNRVRMIVASFLTKHLLVDWRWGEAYFASKLLDYELSSNNGNWQWAAGTGCDAAPYFRVFNPWEQQKKFDPDFSYIKRWIPDYQSDKYIEPIVDHKFARQRALDTYKAGLSK